MLKNRQYQQRLNNPCKPCKDFLDGIPFHTFAPGVTPCAPAVAGEWLPRKRDRQGFHFLDRRGCPKGTCFGGGFERRFVSRYYGSRCCPRPRNCTAVGLKADVASTGRCISEAICQDAVVSGLAGATRTVEILSLNACGLKPRHRPRNEKTSFAGSCAKDRSLSPGVNPDTTNRQESVNLVRVVIGNDKPSRKTLCERLARHSEEQKGRLPQNWL